MNYSVGDGMAVIGVAVGVVGYVYVKYLGRQKRLEVIHQERMVAMEKGIPLPEFPLEPARVERSRDADRVITILGMVLLSLSVGTMIVLYLNLADMPHRFWVAPLPFAFLGAGFLAYYLLQAKSGR